MGVGWILRIFSSVQLQLQCTSQGTQDMQAVRCKQLFHVTFNPKQSADSSLFPVKCVYTVDDLGTSGSSHRDKTEYFWTSWWFCLTGNVWKISGLFVCRCNHLTSFGSHFELVPNDLSFTDIEHFFGWVFSSVSPFFDKAALMCQDCVAV